MKNKRFHPTPQWPAFRQMVRHLGLFKAIKLGATVRRLEKRGAPFEELPEPVDIREEMSRAQIGPALLIYRALRADFSEARALEITQDIVVASGVVFMRKNLGEFSQKGLSTLDAPQRLQFLNDKSEGFFNATIEWTNTSADKVGFEVHSCHFPTLCAAVGLPEVAPIFCAVDAAFFGSAEPKIELLRPRTLAKGDALCDFTLQWTKKS